jgi:hypothetical protein
MFSFSYKMIKEHQTFVLRTLDNFLQLFKMSVNKKGTVLFIRLASTLNERSQWIQ